MSELLLVTGASGYIAGQLIPRLLEKGYRVRCLARDPQTLASRSWARSVEIQRGDLLRPETLPAALEGVRAAYYLIHSMASGKNYPECDLLAARNFARAAQEAHLEHIIYLGGLVDPERPLSLHMRSRVETGEALRQGGVPVTEFRASVIAGPGSISFEMIRYLTEQLPVLAGPRWLRNLSQPIAAGDVIAYLMAALEVEACRGEIIEVGGPNQVPYAENLLAYARYRGLKRPLLTLPYIPVPLMAYAIGLLTPVPAVIARPLVEGLQDTSIVHDDKAARLFPDIRPRDYASAMHAAIQALSPAATELLYHPLRPVQTPKQDGFLLDIRQTRINAAPEAVFHLLAALGGRNGWLFANPLWRLRAALDRLAGGPGMRGRPEVLAPGAAVDFYRVEVYDPPRQLRLRAELKAPGEGWMEWRLEPDGAGTHLMQIAWFAPRGVPGFLYWYLLGPVHRWVFAGMLRAIAKAVER
jgi:uncharacterized protein YbjT (DUF2867 family)/uncharacterized protein YndB with AHSA1/START domain